MILTGVGPVISSLNIEHSAVSFQLSAFEEKRLEALVGLGANYLVSARRVAK